MDLSRTPVRSFDDAIRQVVARSLPFSWRGQPVGDETPLDADGVGLDSVAIVELLLACEEATGLPFSADVLEGSPLTIARLIRYAALQIGSTGGS